MSENIAITHLAECESYASYVCKCKMTSFTAVSSELKKGCLCQIPSDKESEIIPFLQHITVRINHLLGVWQQSSSTQLPLTVGIW